MKTFLFVSLLGFSTFLACGEEEKETRTEPEGANPGECTDGADNDFDGDYDCNDSDCAGSPDCIESDEDTGTDTDEESDQDSDGDGILDTVDETESYCFWDVSYTYADGRVSSFTGNTCSYTATGIAVWLNDAGVPTTLHYTLKKVEDDSVHINNETYVWIRDCDGIRDGFHNNDIDSVGYNNPDYSNPENHITIEPYHGNNFTNGTIELSGFRYELEVSSGWSPENSISFDVHLTARNSNYGADSLQVQFSAMDVSNTITVLNEQYCD